MTKRLSNVLKVHVDMKQLKFNQTTRMNKKNISPCHVFVASFDRPNLSWQIVPKNGPGVNEQALAQLLDLCQEERFATKCGIVYCRTREDTEVTSQYLENAGIPSCHYHAGVAVGGRKWVQRKWMSNHIRACSLQKKEIIFFCVLVCCLYPQSEE